MLRPNPCLLVQIFTGIVRVRAHVSVSASRACELRHYLRVRILRIHAPELMLLSAHIGMTSAIGDGASKFVDGLRL